MYRFLVDFRFLGWQEKYANIQVMFLSFVPFGLKPMDAQHKKAKPEVFRYQPAC